jgi:hypothetical protein
VAEREFAYFDVLDVYLKGRSATHLKQHKSIPCPGIDVKRATPEYKPEALLLEPTCSAVYVLIPV